jgi:bifunctional DNase/RNase
VAVRAASDQPFDLQNYQEAVVAEVRATEKYGHIVLLRLKDGAGSLLPVYIGEFECGALVKEINRKPTLRPLTHDLMKSTLEALGYRVTKVRITALVGNTYHARVHYGRARSAPSPSGDGVAAGGMPAEVDVDARPSDAVNLAVRFGAPIYVNKEVAARMAQPSHALESGSPGASSEHHADVVRSCREEIAAFNDPTIMHKLQMQLAIAEERFEDATTLRDAIDRILASDRALSLVVAMETALEDGRYEEAARLRDEFKALRKAQQLSSSEISEI